MISIIDCKLCQDIATYKYLSLGFSNNNEEENEDIRSMHLKVIYHPLYSMNKFVTNKSKLPQDGAQVFPYMG